MRKCDLTSFLLPSPHHQNVLIFYYIFRHLFFLLYPILFPRVFAFICVICSQNRFFLIPLFTNPKVFSQKRGKNRFQKKVPCKNWNN